MSYPSHANNKQVYDSVVDDRTNANRNGASQQSDIGDTRYLLRQLSPHDYYTICYHPKESKMKSVAKQLSSGLELSLLILIILSQIYAISLAV